MCNDEYECFGLITVCLYQGASCDNIYVYVCVY